MQQTAGTHESLKVFSRMCIVMMGPSMDSFGGISSVVRSYRSAGLFQRWPIVYLPTHVGGSSVRKISAAIVAVCRYSILLGSRRLRVLHVHSASRWSFARKSFFVLTARLFGKPVIFHLHGGTFVDVYEQDLGVIGRWYVRFVLDRCTHIVVLSERWLHMLTSITSNSAITVVPNPVTGPSAASGPMARESGALLFMGRLEERKGIHVLIDALGKIGSEVSWKLYVAGDGDVRGITEQIRRLNLSERVTLLGWVDGESKDVLLRKVVVVILPSYAEGLPVSLIEAMAYGIPVIATPVGGILDLVEHEREGLLVPVGDVTRLAEAIKFVLREPQFACEMGLRGRHRFCEQFSAEIAVPMLEKLYFDCGVMPKTRRNASLVSN